MPRAAERAGRALLALAGAAALLTVPAASRAQDVVPVRLATAGYRAEALGHAAAGTLGWVRLPDGGLRLELARGPAGVGALLDQTGDGWTVILPAAGGGTVNGWGDAWREVPAGWAPAFGQVAAELGRGAPNGPEGPGGPWRAGPSGAAPVRCAVGDLTATARPEAAGWCGAWRAAGWGRGPRGDVLLTSWRGRGPDARLEVRAAGRPGRIRLAPGPVWRLQVLVPEILVPLWPLRDVSEGPPQPAADGEKPGTPAGRRG